MTSPEIGTRQQWAAAYGQPRVAEKALTRRDGQRRTPAPARVGSIRPPAAASPCMYQTSTSSHSASTDERDPVTVDRRRDAG